MLLKGEKYLGEVWKGRKHKHAKDVNNEVNNNTEDVDMIDRKQKKVEVLRVTFSETIEKNDDDEHMTSYDLNLENPFLPGGCVSEDADLMLRMWKEERLTEFFADTEHREEDDEPDAAIKKNVNNDKCDDSDEVVERKDEKRPRKQFSTLCCSVM
eukprot:TRINITY_DN17198_c0_g1_i1.p1 TRINITY_DN17198_c0_g1~~TRINITY_DN17198_c0_g1_i1.p1  ORF type:complete len:155 (-),score=58.61 TRINITY_DN17198_c0_g1_i1:156-620(-)